MGHGLEAAETILFAVLVAATAAIVACLAEAAEELGDIRTAICAFHKSLCGIV
jgi:hypothetical protein